MFKNWPSCLLFMFKLIFKFHFSKSILFFVPQDHITYRNMKYDFFVISVVVQQQQQQQQQHRRSSKSLQNFFSHLLSFLSSIPAITLRYTLRSLSSFSLSLFYVAFMFLCITPPSHGCHIAFKGQMWPFFNCSREIGQINEHA